jgi:hypothetical protein
MTSPTESRKEMNHAKTPRRQEYAKNTQRKEENFSPAHRNRTHTETKSSYSVAVPFLRANLLIFLCGTFPAPRSASFFCGSGAESATYMLMDAGRSATLRLCVRFFDSLHGLALKSRQSESIREKPAAKAFSQ